MSKKREKERIAMVGPTACDCPTGYFYSKFPSVGATAMVGSTPYTFAPYNSTYTKTNSSLYQLDTDGSLIILKNGTYFVSFSALIQGLGGSASNTTGISAMIQLESLDGINSQQLLLMYEPVTQRDIDAGVITSHAHAVLHVGDTNYGIGVYPARMYVILSVDGAIDFNPEMEITVRN